jgi:hypothetical protein
MTNLSNVRDNTEKLMRLVGVDWDELQYISPYSIQLLRDHGLLWLFKGYMKRPKTTLESHAYISAPYEVEPGDSTLTPVGEWLKRQLTRLGVIKPHPWLR